MRDFDFEQIRNIFVLPLVGFGIYRLSVISIQAILQYSFGISLTKFQIVNGLLLITLLRFITNFSFSFIKYR